MKIKFFGLFMTLFSLSFGQMPEIPLSYSFETSEACDSYEPLILNFIDWLNSHPIDIDINKRKQMLKFINEWGVENPNILLFPYCKVSNPIFDDLKNESKKERYGIELYMSYYNGMINYILNNPDNDDLRKVQLAGVENVIRLYENNSKVIFDSEAVKLYMILYSNNSLSIWIDKKSRKSELKRYKSFLKNEINKDLIVKKRTRNSPF